jgi:type IV secretory pathway protease TraF
MEPALSPGDRLLISYGRTPVEGDVVVARFVDGTVAVKRVAGTRTTVSGEPGWWLLSDNLAQGVDSRHRGAVAAEDVLGIAMWRLWPRPGRL